jgi:hypothetical protein
MLWPAEKPILPPVHQSHRKKNVMGDKSPKSNQKLSTQKQSKANSAAEQKKQAVAAKAAPNPRKK